MLPIEQARQFVDHHAPADIEPRHLDHLPLPYRTLGELILADPAGAGEQGPDPAALYLKHFPPQGRNPWRREPGRQLATILYRPEKADLVADVWDLTATLPYGQDAARRAFRYAAGDQEKALGHRLSRMRALYRNGRVGFAGLDVFDCARYAGYYPWRAAGLAPWLAAALQRPATAVRLRSLLSDTVSGEDDIGLPNRGAIAALLMTTAPENWAIVERLLLAARREEGLRQTILESLDQAGVGALGHFIGLILEHDLARFSAVVRAVDAWFGFGWEATKTATVNRTLRLAHDLLTGRTAPEPLLGSKDNLEVYVALWSVAVTDVTAALELARGVVSEGNRHQRLTSLAFVHETGLPLPGAGTCLERRAGEDPETDYWLLLTAPKELELSDRLFERLRNRARALPKEGRTFDGTVFGWRSVTLLPATYFDFLIARASKDHLRLLCAKLAELPLASREGLIGLLFPRQSAAYPFQRAPTDPEETRAAVAEPWQRRVVRDMVSDRSARLRATGLRMLHAVDLEEADRQLIVSTLRRRGKELRAELIRLVLAQDEASLRQLTDALLDAGSQNQRLAGLEILTVLHQESRLLTYVLARAGRYRERDRIGKNERVFLERLRPEETDVYTLANGFGTIDPAALTRLPPPAPQFAAAGLRPSFLFADWVDTAKIGRALNDLYHRFEAHRHYEYVASYQDGHQGLIQLTDGIMYTDPQAYTLTDHRAQLAYLPLAEVWREWYEAAGLNDFELAFAGWFTGAEKWVKTELTDFLSPYLLPLKTLNLPGSENARQATRLWLSRLIGFFVAAHADPSLLLAFQLDVLEDLLARVPRELRREYAQRGEWGTVRIPWYSQLFAAVPGLRHDLPPASLRSLTDEHLFRWWRLRTQLLLSVLLPEADDPQPVDALRALPLPAVSRLPLPDVHLVLELYRRGRLTDDDLRLQSLVLPGLLERLGGNVTSLPGVSDGEPEVAAGPIDELRHRLLMKEIDRGDLPTDATPYVYRLGVAPGADYLLAAAERLGGELLMRGYSFSAEPSRRASLSRIIKRSYAVATDTMDGFRARARYVDLPEKRWLELAMYAPQWAPWIAELLRIEDLPMAVWWFHAHAADYMSAEKESIVTQFSPVPREDFARGGIDVEWFHEAYQSIGRKTWRLLHEAARYVSPGNGHRQVKTYSAVMLGEIKITETVRKIKNERDRVYVKALGLIPFSPKHPEADALRRYNLLQAFERQSRRYGAQRQEKERTAARIGLDNLARNAGHDDTTRFRWIMEGEATRAILERGGLLLDDVRLELVIDDYGKADIRVWRGNKALKAVPAKLRKRRDVRLLKEQKAKLRQQYVRTRASLENAMIGGVRFRREDLLRIDRHPVVSKMLRKLVLIQPATGMAGFWRDDALFGTGGELLTTEEEAAFVLAHPAHLYANVSWDQFQRYAFEEQLVQPFKQIFRELYLPTDDEGTSERGSRRYQGHQLQPRKTLALLRGRGWATNHTIGLQKVFHDQNVIATLYAVADWFSPADVEAPVIETVDFTTRAHERLPLSAVDPVLFSEIMRDVDLVVSVAHVGGVDPAASLGTLRMRAALARESARLFKLANVTVQQRHLVVAGRHGDYAIHLGSGMVTKGGLQLHLVAVQSQHRGRLFLPFLDDDPKSAEIISKMLLLARDGEIRDPTVLGQIMR